MITRKNRAPRGFPSRRTRKFRANAIPSLRMTSQYFGDLPIIRSRKSCSSGPIEARTSALRARRWRSWHANGSLVWIDTVDYFLQPTPSGMADEAKQIVTPRPSLPGKYHVPTLWVPPQGLLGPGPHRARQELRGRGPEDGERLSPRPGVGGSPMPSGGLSSMAMAKLLARLRPASDGSASKMFLRPRVFLDT